MNQLGIALVWCALQVSLLSLIAVALYASARRWGPTARSHIAFAGMVLVLALTALAFSPWPRWQFTFRDGAPSQPAPHTAAAPEVAAQHVNRPALDATRRESAKSEQSEQPSLASAFWTTFVQELGRPQTLPERTEWRWPSVIAVLFLAGIAFGTVRLLAGWWAVRALRRRSKRIHDPALLGLLDVVQAELSCRRPIELRESPTLVTAATIGWRKPLILLPAEWPDWTEAERHAVLAHEIAHIGRHDFAAWIFAECGLVLHFYHPLVHWLAGRLRLEQELAADAAAAAVTGGQRPYLTTLAAMALRQPDRSLSWPARTFLPTRRTFLRRIEMLRDSTILNARASGGLRFATLGLLFLAGLAVAGLRGPDARVHAGSDAARNAELAKDDEREPQPTHRDDVKQLNLELRYVPPNAIGVAVASPALIHGKVRSPQLTEFLKEAKFEEQFGVPMGMIAQVAAVFVREEAPEPELAGFVVDFYEGLNTPDKARQMLNTIAPDANERQFAGNAYYALPGDSRSMRYFLPRRNTLIAAMGDSHLRAFVNASLAGDGADQDWRKSFRTVRESHAAVAFDLSWIAQSLQQRPAGTPQGQLAAMMQMLSPLWLNTQAAALGVSLDDGVNIQGTATTAGEQGAQRVVETAQALLTLARNLIGRGREQIAQAPPAERELMTQIITLGEDLLKSARVTRDDSTIRLQAQAEGDGATALIAAQVFPAVSKAREAAQRQVSMNNLKQIALAMHNYHDVYGHFPPAVMTGPDGKTPRSWRVELLPFLDAPDLYQQYRKDEPWDSEHNKKILEQMPAVFRNPGASEETTIAGYFILTGPKAPFSSKASKEGPKLLSITDGTSNTIAVVEAKRDIPWTKPEDIPHDAEKPLPELGGYRDGGFLAAFFDGSVRFLSETIDEQTLRKLIMPADGQRVEAPPLQPRR